MTQTLIAKQYPSGFPWNSWQVRIPQTRKETAPVYDETKLDEFGDGLHWPVCVGTRELDTTVNVELLVGWGGSKELAERMAKREAMTKARG